MKLENNKITELKTIELQSKTFKTLTYKDVRIKHRGKTTGFLAIYYSLLISINFVF